MAGARRPTVRAGDTITIDGGSGEVFEGAIPGTTEPVPEAATLLGWARELGITVGEEGDAREPTAGQPARGVHGRSSSGPSASSAPRCPEAPPTPRARPDQVQPLLDDLVATGSRRRSTAPTASRTPARDAPRRSSRPSGRNGVPTRGRRSRCVPGAGSSNEGDRDGLAAPGARRGQRPQRSGLRPGVLDRLAALHERGRRFPGRPTPAVRLASRPTTSGSRCALEQALAGDGRFVASPRVDSYHGVWFELHEDLIQLAGRTREDEVAAGRA